MIRIENVAKTFKRGQTEVHALRGVTCEFADGSFNFIFGPSGSGKSTLLYLMGALDEPTAGDIFVKRRSLGSLSRKQKDEYRRHDVGFVFQSFNLLSNLTAVDNVLIPYIPLGVSREQRAGAVDLLAKVGLENRLDHRPHQLSGGEQQRVAIARALLKKPAIVLADEPTGELDSATGAEVFGYLRNLHREHKTTVVVVTHDQRYMTPGDRVIQMRDGTIVSG